MSKKRRNLTPEEKVSILKGHLLEKVPVSNMCYQYNLHPTVFHRSVKKFFEKGAPVLQKKNDSRSSKLHFTLNQDTF